MNKGESGLATTPNPVSPSWRAVDKFGQPRRHPDNAVIALAVPTSPFFAWVGVVHVLASLREVQGRVLASPTRPPAAAAGPPAGGNTSGRSVWLTSELTRLPNDSVSRVGMVVTADARRRRDRDRVRRRREPMSDREEGEGSRKSRQAGTARDAPQSRPRARDARRSRWMVGWEACLNNPWPLPTVKPHEGSGQLSCSSQRAPAESDVPKALLDPRSSPRSPGARGVAMRDAVALS